MPFYGTGTVLFQDEFTYSDGALSTVGSAKWTNGYWTGQPSLRVLSNKAAGPASATWSDNYSTSSISVGTGIEVIWTNITPASGATTLSFGHFLGTAAANPLGYYMSWRNDPSFYYGVGRVSAGNVFTPLISTTVTPVNGDDVAVQVLPDGTISLWRKPSGGSWGQIGSSATDTTHTSGVIALETYQSNDRWDAVEVRQIPTDVVAGAIASAFAGTTVAPVIPTHAVGDPILIVASKNDAATLSLSGWTAIGTPENNANLSTGAWWKVATSASETASVSSTTAASASAGLYAQAIVLDGTVYGSFEDATWNGSPTTSTTPGGATITTTVADTLALTIALLDASRVFASGLPPATWDILGNVSASGTPFITTNYLDSNADGASNAWTKSAGTSASALLDDGVRAPTAPTTGSDQITSGTANQLSDLVFPNTLTYNATDTYTLWVYSSSGAKRGLSTLISVNDSTFANAAALHVAGQAFAWRSRDISSLITSQGTLDGLRVRLRCDSTQGGGGAGVVTVAAVYIRQEVTTPGAGGRITSITKPQAAAGDVTGVTVGTLGGAEYWKTLALAFKPPVAAPTSRLKRWDGSAWVVANLKQGASWTVKPLKKL